MWSLFLICSLQNFEEPPAFTTAILELRDHVLLLFIHN